MPDDPEILAYSISEVVKITGLGRTTVHKLIKDGRLQTTTVGRRRLVLASSLRKLLGITEPDDES